MLGAGEGDICMSLFCFLLGLGLRVEEGKGDFYFYIEFMNSNPLNSFIS